MNHGSPYAQHHALIGVELGRLDPFEPVGDHEYALPEAPAMHTVKLTGIIPGEKIRTIKAIRLASKLYGETLGLKPAKYAADDAEAGLPSVLFEGDKGTASAVVAVLRDAGVPAEVVEPTVTVPLGLAQGILGHLYDRGLYTSGDQLADIIRAA